MDKFKYEKIAPSIREMRSRRALSIIEKALAPLRPTAVMDPRYRQSRVISARNELRVQKSKSFLDIPDSKENYVPVKGIENQNFSLLNEPEVKILDSAPRTVPLTQNKFALEMDKMEVRLLAFYKSEIS